MRIIFACFVIAFACASHADWKYKERVDAMTDEKSRTVSVTSKDGNEFSLIRRSDNTVWGYLQLRGMNQFMVGERLTVRVDKNEPEDFNEDLQNLMQRLGTPMVSWEWNPSLIGFRIWHGKIDEGCATLLQELLNGTQMVVRYHPNKSTTRDVVFNISKNKGAIERALEIKGTKCGA